MGFTALCERLLDGAIAALHETRERAKVGEHRFLSGVFAPVEDEHTAAEVAPSEGAIPRALNGVCVLASVPRLLKDAP
jgi:carotenoid cleavage dioxygenase-like enzyme